MQRTQGWGTLSCGSADKKPRVGHRAQGLLRLEVSTRELSISFTDPEAGCPFLVRKGGMRELRFSDPHSPFRCRISPLDEEKKYEQSSSPNL
jgi:hypothetical protein